MLVAAVVILRVLVICRVYIEGLCGGNSWRLKLAPWILEVLVMADSAVHDFACVG